MTRTISQPRISPQKRGTTCARQIPLLFLLVGFSLSAPRLKASQQLKSLPSGTASTGESASLTAARAQLQAGSIAEAEATARAAIQADPTSADAHFLLGYILFRQIQAHGSELADTGNSEHQREFHELQERDARASLAEFTEGARHHVPSAFDLKIVALDYVLLNDNPDADRWLSKSLLWDPADEQSWYYEGRIKFKEAQYGPAIADFQHALALSPRDVKAEDNLGLAYEQSGQISQAIAAYETALKWAQADGSADDGPAIDLGSVLAEHGRAAEAVPYLVEAAKTNPNDLRAHQKLAEAYRSLGRWPEAQTELQQAVALSPDTASLHFLLGQAYRHNGEAAKANIEMQKSAAIEAQNNAAAREPAPPEAKP